MTALVVLAKAPRPGVVKTRLCPPLTPSAAAGFAAAALADTLDLARRADWSTRVLALDVPDRKWETSGWVQIVQRGTGLDERLGDALVRAQHIARGAPVLLIGMDTPHLHVLDLLAARDLLHEHDAVLGPADDGGFWALGLRHADARLVRGVPMSTQHTGATQLRRLRSAGLDVAMTVTYRDIDTIEDAQCAGAAAPHSRFATALRHAGAA